MICGSRLVGEMATSTKKIAAASPISPYFVVSDIGGFSDAGSLASAVGAGADGAARDQRGGDEDVDVRDGLGVELRGQLVVVLTHLARVTGGGGFLRLARVDVQELAAE